MGTVIAKRLSVSCHQSSRNIENSAELDIEVASGDMAENRHQLARVLRERLTSRGAFVRRRAAARRGKRSAAGGVCGGNVGGTVRLVHRAEISFSISQAAVHSLSGSHQSINSKPAISKPYQTSH